MSGRWLPVPGCPDYAVSDTGDVIRGTAASGTRPGFPIAPRIKRGGFKRNPSPYLMVKLSDGSRYVDRFVHRLVLEAFHRPPRPGEEGNHLNFNTLDNRIENLEWASPSKNALHRDRFAGLFHDRLRP